MKNHWLWMVLVCAIPLFLIFFAPFIGVGSGTWLFSFIVVMFAIHLLIPIQHMDHTHGLSEENIKRKHKDKVEK